MVDTLGQYKILDRIGAGTLGDVYRARDTRLGRTVAVKLPGAELQADRARLDALSHDARAASVLSHPNIAALYEIGDEDGRLFLVFEFVPGEPLEARHRRTPAQHAARRRSGHADGRRARRGARRRGRPRRPHAGHRHDHAERQREDSRLRIRALEEEPDAGRRVRSPDGYRGARRPALRDVDRKTAVRGGATARRLDAAASSTRLSARHSARMRRAATKRPRRLRPSCDRSPRCSTSAPPRPSRRASWPVRRDRQSRAWIVVAIVVCACAALAALWRWRS